MGNCYAWNRYESEIDSVLLITRKYSVIHFLDSQYFLDTNMNYALIFALIITVSYIDLCIHILQLCTKSQMKRESC